MREKVILKFEDENVEGFILQESDEFLKLKLSNGYNINLDKSRVEILEREEVDIEEKTEEKSVEDKDLPKIAILHTGGTIASKVDYNTGAVSAQFSPEELLKLYPELSDKASIVTYTLGNLFSEDMRFSHYNRMLDKVKYVIENEEVEGVIISHGTDTMHYTATALQYGLENLSVPVMIVGAQRSSDRPSSDAFTNLKGAVDFILYNKGCEEKYCRVGICMHETSSDENLCVLDGINSKKAHTSRRDAFKPVNTSQVARISPSNVEILRDELFHKPAKEDISIGYYDEKLRIGFFKAHPNLFPEEIKSLSIYDGVIIEGTGLGHLAVDKVDEETGIHLQNLEELRNLANTTNIVMSSQCGEGEVDLYVYSSGRKILETGVYGNYRKMNSETLFVRLAYALSREEDFDTVWEKNLENF